MPRRGVTPEETALRAANAERLLTDPAYVQAKLDAEATIMARFRKLSPQDIDGMRQCHSELSVLQLIDKALHVRVDRGKVRTMTPVERDAGRA